MHNFVFLWRDKKVIVYCFIYQPKLVNIITKSASIHSDTILFLKILQHWKNISRGNITVPWVTVTNICGKIFFRFRIHHLCRMYLYFLLGNLMYWNQRFYFLIMFFLKICLEVRHTNLIKYFLFFSEAFTTMYLLPVFVLDCTNSAHSRNVKITFFT